jgi:hypothetical protein
MIISENRFPLFGIMLRPLWRAGEGMETAVNGLSRRHFRPCRGPLGLVLGSQIFI